MKRVFIAIPVPRSAVNEIVDLGETHDSQRWRWISKDDAHITLSFLGSVDDPQAALMSDALSKLHYEQFAVDLTDIKTFPSRQHPRVLVLVPRTDRQLVRLLDSVRSCLECVHALDNKRLRPHVTLARARTGSSDAVDTASIKGVLTPLMPISFAASAVNLYNSTTASDRAYYTVLKSIPLAPSRTSP